MKRFMVILFALSIVLYVSNVATYAQSRGSGHGPSVGSSHDPQSSSHGSDHGKDADHNQSHATKDTKHDANFETRIENNPQLKAKIMGMLPAGMDLKTAAMGFKNQGQFIAACHVSKNLNIPFADLKAKMTGIPAAGTAGTAGTTAASTPTNPESLGKAIHDLRPSLSATDVKAEVEKAESEAKADEKTTTTTKPIS